MRVNSSFNHFFAHRWAAGPGIAIVMLTLLFIGSSFTADSDRDLRARQVNLLIREIGHRLLLQAGDSTSPVLPVTEAKDGTFLLRFEREFIFSHDSLLALSQGLLPESQFPSGYTVSVLDCRKASIVYGFQLNTTAPDLLPCRGRRQPTGCYMIEFAFADLYEPAEQPKADSDPMPEEPKASPKPEKAKTTTADHDIDLLPEKLKTTTLGPEIDRLNQNLKSVKIDPVEVNPKLEEVKTITFDSPLINLVWSSMLVLWSVALLIGRFGKSVPTVPAQKQDHPIMQASVPELAALGNFLFDVKEQRLLLGNEIISLTDKECKILELLSRNFGELIPRETLIQKVWIDEGVITGRSLDMFVSKLRKKLSGDPELSITNVHGKGYKLEIQTIALPSC